MKASFFIAIFASAVCLWSVFQTVTACSPTITIRDTNGTIHPVNKRDVDASMSPASMDIVVKFEFDESENPTNLKLIESRFESSIFFQFGVVDRKVWNDNGHLHISYTFPEANLYCTEFIQAAKTAISTVKEAIETKASCKDLLI